MCYFYQECYVLFNDCTFLHRIIDNMPVTWCYEVADEESKYCSTGFPIGCHVSEDGQARDACVTSVRVTNLFIQTFVYFVSCSSCSSCVRHCATFPYTHPRILRILTIYMYVCSWTDVRLLVIQSSLYFLLLHYIHVGFLS